METKWHQGTTYSGSKTHAVEYLGHKHWRTRAACGVRISPMDVKMRSFSGLVAGYCERCAQAVTRRS